MIKLLTVDDEKGITDLLCSFFKQRKFHVLAANSGEEALDIVNKDRPDIVFLDIVMGGMTGLEVLEKVKAIDKNIKVIMLTVQGDSETITKAKALGVDEYIIKPFKVKYLQEVVVKKIQELLKEKA
ncbi:MAG: response regulator [Candidatus Omnitrophica bacterium]|nr:response regulator [Candidatus Omnitrophota bacterium]